MLMRFAGLLCCGVCAVQAQEPGAPAVPDALPVVEGAPADARPVAAEGGAEKSKEARVISSSRQFVVIAQDALVAGALAMKAEEMRSTLQKMLGIGKDWKHTITIRLQGNSSDPSAPNPIRTRINIIAGEPNYQIRVYIGGGVDVDKLCSSIITMLLYERTLRNVSIEAFPGQVELPEWLVVGVEQAVQWHAGKVDRSVYQALFARSEMLSLEQILAEKNPARLDAVSRMVYDSSCGVLMLCLLNQKGGKEALVHLLDQAVLGEGSPEELIKRNFHALNLTENSLHKWWALQLAMMATPTATECLTPLETEKRFAEALMLVRTDPATRVPVPVSFDNIQEVVKIPDYREQLSRNLDQMVHLSVRCFPAYRQIIIRYCQLMMQVQKGRSAKEAVQELGPLIEYREAFVSASTRARDYLDWLEITYLGGKSGTFSSYMSTMDLLRKGKEETPTKMSRYLDDIEALHLLPADAPTPPSIRSLLSRDEQR